MMLRRTLTAGVLVAMLCLASAAHTQSTPKAPAATKPAGVAPPAPAGGSKDYITVLLQNDCNKPILAAAMVNNLNGEWEAQGFWKLNPGEIAEAGRTTNRAYYVYAHELGDPDCAKGCWSGVVEKELQGESWPFLEKTMNPLVSLGDTVKHRFKC